MDNKKKLIIFGVALVIILIALAIYFLSIKENKTIPNDQNQAPIVEYNPEFMSNEEKASRNLPSEAKIQIFEDSSGHRVYRVIRKDEDIVLDPSRVGDPTMYRPAIKIEN